MKTMNFFLAAFLCAALVACDSKPATVKAQGGGTGSPPTTPGDQKPDPDKVSKQEEPKPLVLQKPTQVESEYLNIMQLDLTKADQAWFSFLYNPQKDGSLFFSLAQMSLTLDCAGKKDRSFTRDVLWQEYTDTKRTVLKKFTPSITEYEFKAGKTYVLSYVLLNLKKDFSDCKTATLKFATFRRDF